MYVQGNMSFQDPLFGLDTSLIQSDNVYDSIEHEGSKINDASSDSTAGADQKGDAQDCTKFESLFDKQGHVQELKAAFKNTEQCESKNADIKFIQGASDAQIEAWCKGLLECIIRRHKQGAPFFTRKERAACEHSEEYAQFEERFAAVKEILKTEKRACRRFSTMPGKGWAERLADDPVFERDSIMVNDTTNSSRGQRLQNVRDNSKDIFKYLEKLGKEGVLAGDEYRAILSLAKYNAAPAKIERQSGTTASSKRKFGHDLEATTASGGSYPDSRPARSRSARIGDDAGFSDADMEDIDTKITSSKRRKPKNDKLQPRTTQNVFYQHPCLVPLQQYNQSQTNGWKQSVANIEYPDPQHMVFFPQQPSNISVPQLRNHGNHDLSGGFNNLYMPRSDVYEGSDIDPSTEGANAPDFDEFSEFINY
jgi:hypothetical protein